MKVRHTNSEKCARCEHILSKYQVHPELLAFFYVFRAAHPDAHISASGRGELEQNEHFEKKVSKAKWGQSPHNYEPVMALDWFRLTQAGGASFDLPWFREVMNPMVKKFDKLVHGGDWKFKDWPHVELADWKNNKGKLIS